jgi:predicted amidohydrolase
MRLSLLQFNQIWEDRDANKKKIQSIISNHDIKTDLLIFPEMTLSGFSMDTKATLLNQPDIDFFAKLSKENSCDSIFGGVENLKNNWIALNSDGKRIATYSKNHSFSYGDENKYYCSSDDTETVNIAGTIVTPAICYDLRFAYHFWRFASISKLIIIIANWPSTRSHHWRSLCVARAIENQCYVASVNRIGTGGGLNYSGDSLVIDPLGQIVVDAGNNEGVFTCDLDLTIVDEIRKKFPFINDRKVKWN